MANGSDERHRHFILEGVTETEAFRSRSRGGRPPIPRQNRAQHAVLCCSKSTSCGPLPRTQGKPSKMPDLRVGWDFRSSSRAFRISSWHSESLARERQGIELLNVRQEKDRTHATVFVPDGKLDHFEGLIRDYLAERRNRAGRPRDNQRLIDAISQIRTASLQELWTDDHEAFPSEDAEQFWWEVWLPVRGERQVVIATFRRLAEAQATLNGKYSCVSIPVFRPGHTRNSASRRARTRRDAQQPAASIQVGVMSAHVSLFRISLCQRAKFERRRRTIAQRVANTPVERVQTQDLLFQCYDKTRAPSMVLPLSVLIPRLCSQHHLFLATLVHLNNWVPTIVQSKRMN